MKPHTDFANGYRISYPDTWQSQQLNPSVTGFFAPRESPADMFSENVTIAVDRVPMSISQLVDAQVIQMQNSGGAAQLISRTQPFVAGQPAELIEFRGHIGPVMPHGKPEMIPMQWLQVYVMNNGRTYCFTYTAEPHAYQQYLSQIQTMISSFELN